MLNSNYPDGIVHFGYISGTAPRRWATDEYGFHWCERASGEWECTDAEADTMFAAATELRATYPPIPKG